MITNQNNQIEYLKWLGYASAIILTIIVGAFGIAWLFTLIL